MLVAIGIVITSVIIVGFQFRGYHCKAGYKTYLVKLTHFECRPFCARKDSQISKSAEKAFPTFKGEQLVFFFGH